MKNVVTFGLSLSVITILFSGAVQGFVGTTAMPPRGQIRTIHGVQWLVLPGSSSSSSSSSNSNDALSVHTQLLVSRHSPRDHFLKGCAMAAVGLVLVVAAPPHAVAMPEIKSYSSNARNMERLNSGDGSGGSVYNNNPSSDAGKRRRAMTGCKSATAREEAAENVLNLSSSLSELECNLRVMDGDPEFMLTALRDLDCPTCPYGIATSR
jgi:hypothetical protein